MFKKILLVLICLTIGCNSKVYMPNVKNIRSVNVDEKDKSMRIIIFEMKDGSVTKQSFKGGTKIVYNDGFSNIEAY